MSETIQQITQSSVLGNMLLYKNCPNKFDRILLMPRFMPTLADFTLKI